MNKDLLLKHSFSKWIEYIKKSTPVFLMYEYEEDENRCRTFTRYSSGGLR